VAVRLVLQCTHTGTFFGIPATQRRVTIAENVVMDVSNGKVTKLMGVFDEAGMLRHLGVLPSAA
jgi:predicted ester cyclase